MSNFMHKVKDAVTDRRDEDTSPGYKESKMGENRAFGSSNPQQRTDADNLYGSSRTGPSSSLGSNPYGSTGTGGRATNAGPHDSKLANKMDPRVDSDLDNGRTTNSGPHDSKMANKMDPRVDSDMDNSGRRVNAGPHDSKLANKMDPRVDSDLDNRGNSTGNFGNGGNTQGFQPGNKTQGSQMNSNMPLVDNHETSEENYSSSKQDRKTHREPGGFGGETLTSEDNHSTSAQEHKSHSSTTHTKPCDMGNQGQQGFGGGMAGGSSYNDNRSGLNDNQGVNPTSKFGPEANVRQARAQDQRGGY